MDKVSICHNDDGEDGIRGNADGYLEQKTVNGNSLEKNKANHFDADDVYDFEVDTYALDTESQIACDNLKEADPNP